MGLHNGKSFFYNDIVQVPASGIRILSFYSIPPVRSIDPPSVRENLALSSSSSPLGSLKWWYYLADEGKEEKRRTNIH